MLIWRKYAHRSRPWLWRLLGRNIWMEHHHFLIAKYPREEGQLFVIHMTSGKRHHRFMFPARYVGDVAAALRRLRKEVVLTYTSNQKDVTIRCELPDWAVPVVRRMVDHEAAYAAQVQKRA